MATRNTNVNMDLYNECNKLRKEKKNKKKNDKIRGEITKKDKNKGKKNNK